MQDSFENNSAMLQSADTLESDDSAWQNANSSNLDRLNDRAKQQKKQRKVYEEIEEKEHFEADINLKRALSTLGTSLSEGNEEKAKINDLDVNSELTTEDKIKSFTESIRQGKSPTQILRLLIVQFEHEEAVSTWVENWRNFLKLHQLAETKSPQERKAIQTIIARADFSSKTAFETSLAEIAQSSDISQETKLDIARKFNGENVFSVNELDYTLKEVKDHKKRIEKAITAQNEKMDSLNSEIESLEDEIDKLPESSPKRQELEEKLKQKKEVLIQTEFEMDYLQDHRPENVSFPLRQGFSAKLNSDGSRSIRLDSGNFSLQLPSHKLPFTSTRNLRAINLAFPYKVLRDLEIADLIFSPNVENNAVPTKSQRYMGHLILNALRIDDSRILSEEDIQQLSSDLALLTAIPAKSGKECLIELGVFDVVSQSVNERRLKEVLEVVRENRGIERELLWEKLKHDS